MTATNVSDALQIYEKNYYKIDLVILEMMMPAMTGLDCFIFMKKINFKVKGILASGYTKQEDLDRIKNEGINGFVKKPYISDQLIQEIESVCF